MRCDRLPPPPGKGAICLGAAEQIWLRSLGPSRCFGAGVSDLFREIDEELRRDNLLKLWREYGKYIIALVVLVLLIAGGIVAWRDHQATERRAQGGRFASALALAREGKDADAAKLFARVAEE